ncbi:MAG: vWA domain-containing protein, partial [Pseudomonadota bacterium]
MSEFDKKTTSAAPVQPSASAAAPAAVSAAGGGGSGSGSAAAKPEFNYRLPTDLTMKHAVKLAIVEDKPIMLDYWTASLDKKALVGAKESGEKYLVVLTDGETADKSSRVWDAFARQAAAMGVNWTSIAVGTDADQSFMKTFAAAVGGQYFYCGTAARVPKVFISQARQVARQEVEKREPFVPRAGMDFSILKGISAGEFPSLADALDATAKPGSHQVLLGRGREALLTTWRYGLGNVMAFASTPKSDWAADWARWPKT